MSKQIKETCYLQLKGLPNGQYEITDIRKDFNDERAQWLNSNGLVNYWGEIVAFEFAEGNYGRWIKAESTNSILYLPKSIGSEEIVGLTSSDCLADRSPIKGLMIPEGYEYIGRKFFLSHPTLEFVSLPNGLKRIGQSAFKHCPNLKHVFLE